MNNAKWQKYLRIDKEPPPTSEQEDNMKYYGENVLSHNPILDVGCGRGMLVDWLRKHKKNAFGITIMFKDIVVGNKKYQFSRDILRLGDMHEIPFPDNHFEAIHCKDVYEHAIAPFIVMCEFNRILKIGGLCYIVIPGTEWIKCDYHYSLLNEAQMREMFRKCNFELRHIEVGKPPVGGTQFSCYSAYKIGNMKWD